VEREYASDASVGFGVAIEYGDDSFGGDIDLSQELIGPWLSVLFFRRRPAQRFLNHGACYWFRNAVRMEESEFFESFDQSYGSGFSRSFAYDRPSNNFR
jgi:hypothetical protein